MNIEAEVIVNYNNGTWEKKTHIIDYPSQEEYENKYGYPFTYWFTQLSVDVVEEVWEKLENSDFRIVNISMIGYRTIDLQNS
jgi:hypothetical protein